MIYAFYAHKIIEQIYLFFLLFFSDKKTKFAVRKK